jgi:hypothetical protein
LPWRGPTIGFRRAALNDLLIEGGTASTNLEDFFDGTGYAGGTAKLGVDVVAISGDATAADNEEKFFDGTGYAGTNNVIPTVTTLTGHTAQTGDAYARLGAPAGASVSADVAAIKAQTAAIETDTQDLQTQIGTDGAGLTNMPWSATWDAEVQSEVADALAVYDPPTNAEMEARTLVAADYVVVGDTIAGVTTVTTTTNLTNLPAAAATAAALAVVDGIVDDIKAVTVKLDTALELDVAVYRFTENALEEAPTGGSAPTVEEIRAEIDTNSTKLADILTDTGTTIPAQNSGLNNLSAAQVTAAVPTASENAAAVITASETTPIEANVKEFNDVPLVGNGTDPKFGVA